MEQTQTISTLLGQATKQLQPTSLTARLDAELLLAEVLGWQRSRLLAEGRSLISAGQASQYWALIQRRSALEPVAYLIGRREFYGLEFLVDQRVLVPRPETELLVELALGLARQRPVDTIADLGTGSGAIAIALAAHLPETHIIAIDYSVDALAVARQNSERHQLQQRVDLRQGDLFSPLQAPVDLIVSNPPYTILSQIDEGVRRYEPHLALDGGQDGLDLYHRILATAPNYLKPHGAILLEIGAEQGQAVSSLGSVAFPQAVIEIHRDLAGLDRVVVIDTQEMRK